MATIDFNGYIDYNGCIVRTYVMVVRGKVVSISVAPGYHVYIAGGLALILSFGVKEFTSFQPQLLALAIG